MVYFQGRYDGDERYLCILDDGESQETETRLLVREPMNKADDHGEHTITPSDYPEDMTIHVKTAYPGVNGHTLISTLPTQLVQDTTFSLLGRDIISGKTKWSSRTITINGAFRYTAGYWEWTENVISRCGDLLEKCGLLDAVYASLYSYDRDPCILRAFCEAWCPTTNTLHTKYGEFSISLWDLFRLSGLPVLGSFYDETIPSYEDLQRLDAQGCRDIPKACHFLLIAYHHLMKQSKGKGVTISQWINFWFKGGLKYSKYRKRHRTSRNPPKVTKNPSGEIEAQALVWSDDELKIFDTLGIVHEVRRETTYLAAFLSCWLCNFVFPSDGNFIRPGTFKIASMMARGKTCSLAVPVLASIYNGLRVMCTSSKPNRSAAVFPAHYLYGWLAYYFKTHHEADPRPKGPRMTVYSGSNHAISFSDAEARKLIHDGELINLGCFMRSFSKGTWLCDDGTMNNVDFVYFINLRSAYIPLRLGESFILEPYCPYRFGKQFGFFQGVPNLLEPSESTSNVSPEGAMKMWRLFVFEGSRSRVHPVSRPGHTWRDADLMTYVTWWKKVCVNDLLDNASLLNSILGREPLKKASKAERKKREPSESPDPSDSEGTADSSIAAKSPPKPTAASRTRRKLSYENDEESDTDFKHRRRGKATKDDVGLDTSFDNFFADVPIPQDVPIGLELVGDFNLDEEVPELLADSIHDALAEGPITGVGKGTNMVNPLLVTASTGSIQVANNRLAPSPTRSQESVRGPHSVEVAAKSLHTSQEKRSNSISSRQPNKEVPAPSEITSMPETAVKGILLTGLKMTTTGLLKTLKEAPFDDVEKIAKEASYVYRCIRHLKGNPTRLQERVESYSTVVKAFQLLQAASGSRRRSNEVDKEIALKRESVQKAQLALVEADKESVAIAERGAAVAKEITEIEDKLRKACELLKQLGKDAETVKKSSDVLQSQIKETEAQIVDLEAAPKLSAEDVTVLEEHRRQVVELQSSLDPDSWQDLVS